MLFAVLCWAASAAISKTGEAAPGLKIDLNLFRSTFRLLRELRSDQRLWRTGVMVSLFWVIGAVIMSLLPPMVKEGLGGSELVVSVYLAVFAVSIAIGSGTGSWLSSGRIVLLPVPIAAVVMGLFAIGLGWSPSVFRLLRRQWMSASFSIKASPGAWASPFAAWRSRAASSSFHLSRRLKLGPTRATGPGLSRRSTCFPPRLWSVARLPSPFSRSSA